MLVAQIVEQTYDEFELAGLPAGWMRVLSLLALVGLGYIVVWLYRREARGGCTARLRGGMAALRCAALVLLAAVWLDPVVATYTVRKLAARVIVLTDVSASMAIRDVPGADGDRAARLDPVSDVLRHNDAAWLRALQERNGVAWYTFGEQTRRMPLPWVNAIDDSPPGQPDATLSDLAATDPRTDLGQALQRAMGELGDSPVAAIVVFSDGAINTGPTGEALASSLRQFDVPVHTVTVGATQEPPNVRVTDFRVPATVAKGDPVELRVDLGASGIEPTDVTLDLVARYLSSDIDVGESSEQVLESRDLRVGPDSGDLIATFEVSPEHAGEYVYSARVRPLPGEPVVADNQRDAVLRVLDERLRVLIIAGRPSYDYRFVHRLLERDQTIDVSCWLQSADAQAVRDGDTVITELPRGTEALLEYDVILLMDPEPSELDSAWAIGVRRFVDEFGGGLFLQAGTHFASRFLRDPRLDELITLLPVSADPDADVSLSAQGAYRTQATGFAVPDDAWAHPLVRLHDHAATNRQIWDALPGAWWYLPVSRAKPLATVLLRQAGPSRQAADAPVLFAAHPFGAGRTAFLAFDSPWRWRATAEPYYNRFWIQLVRYLGQSRREGASKRGSIVLDRDEINLGDFVRIEVRVLGEDFAPWHEPTIGAQVVNELETRTLELERISGRPGWFAGRFSVDFSGAATIRVPLPQAADEPETLVKRIHIFRPNLEMLTLRAQRETMRRLSEHTGGRSVEIGKAGEIPDWIPNATRRSAPVRSVDRTLWDESWVLALLAGLLAVEWTLRRRNHLL
jgi:hypothetical protein